MVVRKMKEKCKDAARMRREKERAEFVELSKLLPLPSSTTSQLDKASIIRLTSSYLKMRSAFPEGLGENWGNSNRFPLYHQQTSHKAPQYLSFSTNGQFQQQQQQQQMQQVRELGSLILQTLDGFVFALHKDGKIMYISETASVHLGLPQIDLTGSSLFEYVHPSDHNDIYDILSLNETDKTQLELNSCKNSCELGRSFCMRMKCILPKRNAGLVSSGYKAIHCNGYLKVKHRKVITSDTEPTDSSCQEKNGRWESYALVAVGHSLLPTASTEVKLTGNSFMFRANLDLKIHYIEAPITTLLGFQQIEMVGQSLYQFVHLSDILALEKSHRSLLEKGQVVTKYYKLMKKEGGFVWIQSYATLVNNPRNMPKPQHVVSICFVLAENQLDQSGIFHHQDQDLDKAIICAGNVKSAMSNYVSATASSNQRIFSHQQLQQQLKRESQRKEKNSTFKKTRKINKPSATNANIQIQHNNSNKTSNHCHETHYQCLCLQNTTGLPNLSQSIGSIRRPSDDTCSIVSSVASTSISSASSQVSIHQTSEFFGYTTSESYPLATNDHLIPLTHSYPLDSIITKTTSQDMMEPNSAVSLYEDFSQHQSQHHQQLQQHQQQQQIQIASNGGPMIQRNVGHRTEIAHQIWLTPTNERVEDLRGISMASTNEYMATFDQSSTHQFQSSPDWLSQANCSNTLILDQRNSQLAISYQTCKPPDEQLNSFTDTSMGSHYHDSPLYLGTSGTMIHHQQVPVNNGYIM